MMFLFLSIVILGCENVVAKYFGTVVTVNDNTEYVKEDFENFATSSNWTIEGLKVTEKETGEHVLEPVVSMTGNEWGSVSTKILLPGDCPHMARLGISFRLYVKEMLLTDLSRMNVMDGVWTKYQVEIIITMGRMYLLEMKMMKGMTGQTDIFVDDLSLDYAHVLNVADNIQGLAAVDNNCSDNVEPSTTSTTKTTEEVLGTNSTTTTQEPVIPVTANNETNASENVTNINTNETTTASSLNKTVTNIPEVHTTIGSINTTKDGNATVTEEGLKAGTNDNSLYGYAGEVVLICLTVLFLILFVLMAVKYHRLKTRFGGYDVDIGDSRASSSHNNPAYDVQMNYRGSDE